MLKKMLKKVLSSIYRLWDLQKQTGIVTYDQHCTPITITSVCLEDTSSFATYSQVIWFILNKDYCWDVWILCASVTFWFAFSFFKKSLTMFLLRMTERCWFGTKLNPIPFILSIHLSKLLLYLLLMLTHSLWEWQTVYFFLFYVFHWLSSSFFHTFKKGNVMYYDLKNLREKQVVENRHKEAVKRIAVGKVLVLFTLLVFVGFFFSFLSFSLCVLLLLWLFSSGR